MAARMCVLLFLCMITVSNAAPFLVRLRRSTDDSNLKSDAKTREAKAIDFYTSADLDQGTDQTQNSNLNQRQRQNKALGYFDYLPQFFSTDEDYGEDELVLESQDNGESDDISRTIPPRRKQNPYKDFTNTNSLNYDNSPIYYIRLPPTPYMFVPGLGYVSQPPNIGAPVPQVNPFINLPLDFVSNGKPTNVYQWNGAPSYQPSYQPTNTFNPIFPRPQRPQVSRPSNNYNYQRPQKKPTTDNKVTNLNKGPYVFNGKPSDIFVLRDSYNSLYSDALQNFYP